MAEVAWGIVRIVAIGCYSAIDAMDAINTMDAIDATDAIGHCWDLHLFLQPIC